MTLIKIAPSQTLSGATQEGSVHVDPAHQALLQERALRVAEARALNSQRTEIQGTDISTVPWPDQPHYGWDHHKHTQEMTHHILLVLKSDGVEVSDRDLLVAKTAALYHDLGRARPWQYADTHADLSARLADSVMRAHPETASYRDEVCRLISMHRLPLPDSKAPVPPPRDPRLVALWDADCLESARFFSGPDAERTEGFRLMCFSFGQLITPWARLLEVQRRYRDRRGGG